MDANGNPNDNGQIESQNPQEGGVYPGASGQPQVSTPPQNGIFTGQTPQPNSNEAKPKTPKALLIVLGVVILALVGVVIALKGFGGGKADDGGESTIISSDQIYDKKIESITIKYYQGYNIATGEAIKEFIPLNEVKIESNDLEALSKLIKSLKKISYSKDSEEYGHLVYDHLIDEYELDINSDFVIYIGEQYGTVKVAEEYFKVPEELYKKVFDIAEANSEKNLYKKIGGKKFTVICNGEEEHEITDEDAIQTLSNYNYYALDSFATYSGNWLKDEEAPCTLNVDNGKTISLYGASTISYIDSEEEKGYIYTDELDNYINKMFADL